MYLDIQSAGPAMRIRRRGVIMGKQMHNTYPERRLIGGDTARLGVDIPEAALSAGHKIAAGAHSRDPR
jgi:hypothetical protein